MSFVITMGYFPIALERIRNLEVDLYQSDKEGAPVIKCISF